MPASIISCALSRQPFECACVSCMVSVSCCFVPCGLVPFKRKPQIVFLPHTQPYCISCFVDFMREKCSGFGPGCRCVWGGKGLRSIPMVLGQLPPPPPLPLLFSSGGAAVQQQASTSTPTPPPHSRKQPAPASTRMVCLLSPGGRHCTGVNPDPHFAFDTSRTHLRGNAGHLEGCELPYHVDRETRLPFCALCGGQIGISIRCTRR